MKNATILKTDVGVKFQDHLFAHFAFEYTIAMLKTKGFLQPRPPLKKKIQQKTGTMKHLGEMK